MQSKAPTVEAYLAGLPADRREALSAVREVILQNLDRRGFEEGIQYGMIGYYVPHAVFPAGYHADPKQPLPFASLASQKSHMSLHLMGVYGSQALALWFREAWAKTGKKLDMGKSCVRFKKLSDLPLEVIGEAIKRVPAQKYIEQYQATLVKTGEGRGKEAAPAESAPAPKKAAAAKEGAGKKLEAAKKVAAKETAAKKTAAKKTVAR